MSRRVFLQSYDPSGETAVTLHINSGVTEELIDNEGDTDCCFFPKSDWHLPEPPVAPARLGSAPPVAVENAVTILRIDPNLLTYFWKSVAPAVLNKEAADNSERACVLRNFTTELTISLPSYAGVELSSVRSSDLTVNPAGRCSTAFDYHTRRFVGLHIDDHVKLSVHERATTFQLLCINLGPAERYLHFVDLSVAGMLGALGKETDIEYQARCRTIRYLTEDFFHTHPSYPIKRVRLDPGQAYLAPTQNIIHDGATNNRDQPDVVFMVCGWFRWSARHL
jgi:hypothetical protein